MRGSITKLPSGSYRLRVEGIPRTDGRRTYVARTFRGNRQAAEKALTQLLLEVGRGQHLGCTSTVSELVEAWFAKATLGLSTRRDYRSAINLHIKPRIGSMRVEAVRAVHLDHLYADLRTAELGAARIRRVHTILSSAFMQAVRWEWISRNPARDASPYPVPKAKVIAPTVAQVRQLVDAADPVLGLFVRLDASLGARRGEVTALRWSDVDLAARRITIAEALIDGGPGIGVVRKATKTDDDRHVTLDSATISRLKAHRRDMRATAMQFGLTVPPDAYLFAANPSGTIPLRPDAITKRFKELRERLEIPDEIKMKHLRHFVATQMLGAGVDVRTVAGRLGHKRASTTLDIYAAFIPGNDEQAADALGELLG